MKTQFYFHSLVVMLLMFALNEKTAAQSIVKKVDVTSEQANVQFASETPSSYFVEIGGPDNYYWKQRVDFKNTLSLSNRNKDGERFKDGNYTLQVTPIITLDDRQRELLKEVRQLNDVEAIAKFRKDNGLPDVVDIYSISFSIQEGKFVNPNKVEGRVNLPTYSSAWEQDHPTLYASIHTMEMSYAPGRAMDYTNSAVDQVINDDLIVSGGSACIGFDCVNGESFGFDTVRLKENNLRIKFDDTSNSASFPNRDWQLTANDSSNGGANKFSIDDITGGKTPFTLEAGAPSHSLYVDDGGRVGFGTSTPVVEAHVVDGDSPTLRLEQNGSSGFTAQTWDVAGNEANFFVRDVTNGSLLPFKIKPGAPTSTLFLAADGDVGVGLESPDDGSKLDVKGSIQARGNYILNGQDAAAGEAGALIGWKRTGVGSSVMRFYNEWTAYGSWGTTFGLDIAGNGVLQHQAAGDFAINTLGAQNIQIGVNNAATPNVFVQASDGFVGVNTLAPSHQFTVIGEAAKSVAGQWTGASDRRLKKDIKPFTDGLAKVLEINPVSYKFNGKGGTLDDGTEHVGVIAQEIQEIAPYTVGTFTHTEVEMIKEEGAVIPKREVKSTEEFLSYNGTAINYMLVNAVKEQQAMIDAQQEEIANLKAEVASLKELKAQVAELTQMMKGQSGNAASNSSDK